MYFEEKQKLNIWWVYVILGIQMLITFLILIFSEKKRPIGSMGTEILVLIVAFFIPLLIIYLMQKAKLNVRIDIQGISYSYSFLRPKKRISWVGINKVYLRKFDAYSEYGGIGVRYRLLFKMKDKAYILNQENIGLQLILNRDRKVLFSTNRKDELHQFLINLKNTHPHLPIETHVGER